MPEQHAQRIGIVLPDLIQPPASPDVACDFFDQSHAAEISNCVGVRVGRRFSALDALPRLDGQMRTDLVIEFMFKLLAPKESFPPHFRLRSGWFHRLRYGLHQQFPAALLAR